MNYTNAKRQGKYLRVFVSECLANEIEYKKENITQGEQWLEDYVKYALHYISSWNRAFNYPSQEPYATNTYVNNDLGFNITYSLVEDDKGLTIFVIDMDLNVDEQYLQESLTRKMKLNHKIHIKESAIRKYIRHLIREAINKRRMIV